MSSWTIFQPQGGGGAGTIPDYVKDNFQDTTIPPTSNTGFTDSASTNPLGEYFLNDDAPKFSAKTLWIKDMTLIEERGKWINNKPTYRIQFTEQFPGVVAYCAGDIRLRTKINGPVIQLRQIDDLIGVTGVVRRLQWILLPIDSTGTADIVTDGSDTGSDVDFGSAELNSLQRGVTKYFAHNHQSSNATKDIHDFRLTANEFSSLQVAGVVVYFENATQTIDLFPGNTYVNKTKVTTANITGASLTLGGGQLGNHVVIHKAAAGSYTQTSTTIPTIYSLATGSSGTNSLSVSTGHGSSFPIGSGVIAYTGASYYVGSVLNVSTDTLTIGPTLPIALSGATMWKSWRSGPTLAIGASLYSIAYSFDPYNSNTNGQDTLGFGDATSGDFYYSDPQKRFRLWSDNMQLATVNGYPGINWASSGFLQIEGRFAALDIEYACNGILHATFMVNGVPGYGVNQGATGLLKHTIMTDNGPGWNSVVMTNGTSMVDVNITKINFYNLRDAISVSTGILASYDLPVANVPRNAINATLGILGSFQRVYADDMFLQGAWTRGTTTTSAGGVFFTGATTTSVMKFNYFGTDYALIGSAGSSAVLLFDGASTSVSFNAIKSVATLSIHTIEYQHKNGTSRLEALEFVKSDHEMVNKQTVLPRPELDQYARVWRSAQTPQTAKSGDLWFQYRLDSAQASDIPKIWIRCFDQWVNLTVASASDDPNAVPVILMRSHGTTTPQTNPRTGATGATEHYNFVTWSSGTTDSTAKIYTATNECQLGGKHWAIDGCADSTNSSSLMMRGYNKTSWAAYSTRAVARAASGAGPISSKLAVISGATDISSVPSDRIDTWNGTTWTDAASTTGDNGNGGCFLQNNILHKQTANNGGGSRHLTYDGSTGGTTTAASTAGGPVNVRSAANKGASSGADNLTTGEEWSGSWATSINMPAIVVRSGYGYQGPACGYYTNTNTGYSNGGVDGSVNVRNQTYTITSSAWTTGTSSSTSTSTPCVSVF